MGILEHEISQLVKQIDFQKQLFHRILESSPAGYLNTRTDGNITHYVHAIPADNGKYIRRNITRDDLVRRLAQKEYARKALKILTRHQSIMQRVSGQITDITPSAIIPLLRPSYRSLPPHYFIPDSAEISSSVSDPSAARLLTADSAQPTISSLVPEARREDLRHWAAQPYETYQGYPEYRNKETSRGLMVRSKSEVLLCEKHYEFDLPFRYEQVIHINGQELAPDFTYLDRYNQEFYMEYCGRMDDPRYVNHYLWKRHLYESAGIYDWTNMIYIFEKNNQINMKHVENVLREQVLPRL